MAECTRICCGVDFSEISRLAMDESAYWARAFGAGLTLLHVYERPASGLGESPGESRRKSRMTLLAWRAQAEFLADRPVTFDLLEGDPATEIARYAREKRLDLIVVGTYGRHGVKELVLGSVAERVVRLAHCPVLVVRHRPRATLEEDEAER